MRKPNSGSRAAAATISSSAATKTTTPCCTKIGLKRGPWTPEEDELLSNYIKKEGEGKWRTLPKKAGLLRCGKSCRLRWMNYLRPSVKRGQISSDEEDLILRLHRLLGNRWALIAGRIPGRTDNEIKNYWNTHLSKKLISQGIDPRTHKPLHPNPNPNNSSSSFPPPPTKPTLTNKSNNLTPNPNSSGSMAGDDAKVTDDLDPDHNWLNSNEGDDIGYCCNDDVFSSFLNSLINEDVFVNQPNANSHIETLVSSARSFGHGAAISSSAAGFDEEEHRKRMINHVDKRS